MATTENRRGYQEGEKGSVQIQACLDNPQGVGLRVVDMKHGSCVNSQTDKKKAKVARQLKQSLSLLSILTEVQSQGHFNRRLNIDII